MKPRWGADFAAACGEPYKGVRLATSWLTARDAPITAVSSAYYVRVNNQHGNTWRQPGDPMNTDYLRVPPTLPAARAMAHAAAQLLYRAAAANNVPLAGDEHSNLGWDGDQGAFATRMLANEDLLLSLSLAPLVLCLGEAQLPLVGVSQADACAWLDGQLVATGLRPASTADIPYNLPDEVLTIDTFQDIEGLADLAAWYTLACTVLQELETDLRSTCPAVSEVRSWPHHFDIAIYAALEEGDPEEARGIGVGMSPGDESYDEPYFYINPWPHIDIAALPAPITPGHWHTKGFVGSVATASEILTLDDRLDGTLRFIRDSFDVGKKALG